MLHKELIKLFLCNCEYFWEQRRCSNSHLYDKRQQSSLCARACESVYRWDQPHSLWRHVSKRWMLWWAWPVVYSRNSFTSFHHRAQMLGKHLKKTAIRDKWIICPRSQHRIAFALQNILSCIMHNNNANWWL